MTCRVCKVLAQLRIQQIIKPHNINISKSEAIEADTVQAAGKA